MNNLEINELKLLLNNKSILITGGTGSFGYKMTEIILKYFEPKRLIILSRDEYKQFIMQQQFPIKTYPCMRYFIGDIRDKDRLDYAFKNVDIIFHAAALKQVPALEYNPTEAIKTNIIGSQNVIDVAIKNNVKRVIAISTDKATCPTNLYGATKMCMEKIFVSANYLSGCNDTIFSVARYGNVFGSRGSVVPIFLKQKETGTLTITNKDMTRFNFMLSDAIYFVLNCLKCMVGTEIFIPKLFSYNILQLANIIAPNCEKKIIGIRPGEKVHESMIGNGEWQYTLDCKDFFIITPVMNSIMPINYKKVYERFNPINVDFNFTYSSNNNKLINNDTLKKYVLEFEHINS